MLYADKAALENRTKVRLLSIRERELALYTNNCRTVGTVAALMAGLAFSALIYTKMSYFQSSAEWVKFLYCMGIIVCMCLSLDLVLATTAITMLGPGLALRGPDGSMHSAVDGILHEFELVSRLFRATIGWFLAVVVVWAWSAAAVGLLCSLLLTLLVAFVWFVMLSKIRTVEHDFPLTSVDLVSGAFFDRNMTMAQHAGRVGQPQPSSKQAQAQAAASSSTARAGGYERLPGGGASPSAGPPSLMADSAPPLAKYRDSSARGTGKASGRRML